MTHAPHPSVCAPAHGADVPRGLDPVAVDTPGRGRFGRMFPGLPVRELSDAALEALVTRLLERSGELRDNASIPAGYTYLGQFVDHDLTFDPSSLGQRDGDPQALADVRTPRLDLDSLYGSGPSDQPYLYESTVERWRGVKLVVDDDVRAMPPGYVDLPRNAQGRALIGDPRNDENLIVAQLHLLFIQFHNAVVEHVAYEEQLAGRALFGRAQQLVRWHYQWIVCHDFLRRIVGDTMTRELVDAVLTGGGRRCLRFDGEPFMPVEFSGAAYRFGHSMVRPGYPVNSSANEQPIMPLSPTKLGLRGFRRLPSELVIDWRFFFALAPPPRNPTPSTPIDTAIAKRLFHLPADIGTDGQPQLPRLNLLRARRLRLPSGPDIARAMGIKPLDAVGLQLDTIPDPEIRTELLDAAPLWYYVLCEAEALHAGVQLGEVGGRIVAETLVSLLEADPRSYVHASPQWTPTLDRVASDDFTMSDLVRFAHPQYRNARDDRARRT